MRSILAAVILSLIGQLVMGSDSFDKRTLRQEIGTADAVVVCQLLIESERKGDESQRAWYKIRTVVQGHPQIQVDQKIEVSSPNLSKDCKHLILMWGKADELQSSIPLPISERAEEYILKVLSLSDELLERNRFCYRYLEDPDPILARDAHDELALSSYEDLKQIECEMQREELIKWIKNDQLPAERKRLYFTMLGICGRPEDADLVEAQIRGNKPEEKSKNLDAIIACYLSLKGDAGLSLIEDLFLKNKQASYNETYAAVMALRFHGREKGGLPRAKIIDSMHHLLQRPAEADLVIPDLAYFEDWSQVDRMVALFKDSEKSNEWIKIPVINYLRVCPLPESIKHLKELQKLDPKAVLKARKFFPTQMLLRDQFESLGPQAP